MTSGMEMKCDLTSRTPVERAFYESFIMSNRWAVARLYAVNILESTKFKTELKHLGQERKTNLLRMDDAIEKTRASCAGYNEEKEQVLFLPTTNQGKVGVTMTPVQVRPEDPATIYLERSSFVIYRRPFDVLCRQGRMIRYIYSIYNSLILHVMSNRHVSCKIEITDNRTLGTSWNFLLQLVFIGLTICSNGLGHLIVFKRK